MGRLRSRLRAKFKRFTGIHNYLRRRLDPSTSQTASIPAVVTVELDDGPSNTEYKVSIPKTKAQERNGHSGIESLPPEIRRLLLSILDLPRLKALVRASPTFHKQYRFDRKHLLCRSLEGTLASATVDAYAVHQFTPQEGNTILNIAGFLTSYSENTSQRRLPLGDKITEDEAVSLAAFHLRYVQDIMEYCFRWTLDILAENVGMRAADFQQKLVPTRTESMRFTRAIYRFQVLSDLTLTCPDGFREHRVDVYIFLDILKPWEIEELFSFYQCALAKYDQIFQDILWDLHPDNPKFDDQDRPPTPTGAFDLSNTWYWDTYLEGTTLRGLSLLHKVLFQTKDHEDLVSMMQRYMRTSYIPFNKYEGVLGETRQYSRRREDPSKRDQKEQERVSFPFRGDAEPDAPPLSWTMIWGDTYCNLYGWFISDEMRRWGYIFWDAVTLERTGGKEVLKRQWEEHCIDDPRGDLL
ncbi:hypothetical protein HD806DRAFT_514904 [Xylariaceae sp. AK1471]|nr:hypothetical protein HD806DRAFT_514904 [Xylariaceae sp. AK1471]